MNNTEELVKKYQDTFNYISNFANNDWAHVVVITNSGEELEQWAYSEIISLAAIDQGLQNAIDRFAMVLAMGFIAKLDEEGMNNGQTKASKIEFSIDENMFQFGGLGVCGIVTIYK